MESLQTPNSINYTENQKAFLDAVHDHAIKAGKEVNQLTLALFVTTTGVLLLMHPVNLIFLSNFNTFINTDFCNGLLNFT